LAEAAPDAEAAAEILRGEPPPAWADSIEAPMDSVITHEAYLAPEIIPEAIEAPAPDIACPGPCREPASAPTLIVNAGPAPDALEQRNAEEEDRLGARYGFRSPAEDTSMPAPEMPEPPGTAAEGAGAPLAHRPDKS